MAENKITQEKIAKTAVSSRQVRKTAPKKSPLELLLEAVNKAREAGITVKGVYSVKNEDGTTNNGSLK